MNEHIREHIPALIEAIKEVPNYNKNNSVKRVENFEVESIGSNHVKLKWDAKTSKDIFLKFIEVKEINFIVKRQTLLVELKR